MMYQTLLFGITQYNPWTFLLLLHSSVGWEGIALFLLARGRKCIGLEFCLEA